VEYAEPNYLREITAVDPKLWAFYNPGGLTMTFTRKGSGVVTSKISTSDADEDNVSGYAAGGADVTVGSIDTGVDFTHPEFAGTTLIKGKDWYSNDNDPTDGDDHGTHTTGTMVGKNVGIAGVSGATPHVRVYVQRVCGQRGCPTTAIVNAINAAADYIDANGNHLVAVNLSLGGSSESQAEKDAIAHATANGVLIIASAGNDGVGTVSCPACDVNAISVSATNWQDVLAQYSNWGSGLDISAPGGECYSNTTAEGCIYSSVRGGKYAWFQGTSMAAPQVTGTAGIVASKTGLRGSALRSRLLSTTDSKSDASRFGAGRLNSYRAVTGTSLAAGQ
jgi:subtilisin family serine protease